MDKKELEIISIWNGELHKDYIERKPESQFLEQIENYKKTRKINQKTERGAINPSKSINLNCSYNTSFMHKY